MSPPRLKLPAEPPESYADLVALYPPRKIYHQAELVTATEVADWLALRATNDAHFDYLELLVYLTERYRREVHGPLLLEEPTPLELLNHLVEENQITTRELGEILGVDHSVAARILKGERGITTAHAKKLGERFALSPAPFLGI